MFPQNDLRTRRRLTQTGIGFGAVLALILAAGTGVRLVEASNLKAWTSEAEIPTVSLIAPATSGKGQTLNLPGTLQAYYDAPLYARVPGYVHAWFKDIGAKVKKGELLATIDTPELDQQIAQARADLGAAQAAERLSATTAQRWRDLLPTDAVSRQDVEEKEENLASKTSAVTATQANLDRMLATKSFARIVAPFDGTVTQRNADIGALVSGGPGANGAALFAVSDIHRLRLYVNVPQAYSAQIVPGMTVSLTVPEYAGKSFPARLVSTANAISTQSSTLLAEMEADNEAGLLKPGDSAQVSMRLPGNDASLRLPASALIFRADGLQVATLGAADRIVMKTVTIGTDLGAQVTIASGLSPRDRVVDNPPDSLTTGDKVRVVSHAG